MTNTIGSKSLISFVDRLIEEKNFENVDKEILDEIKNDLLDKAEERINAVIIDNIPAEKLSQFEELIVNPNEEELARFCHDNIPGLDELIAKELLEFRNTYLNS